MADDIRIEIKPFDELTLRELHACLKLRGEVFVVGQQICCEPDPDDLDPKCHHVMMWRRDELVGTARILVTHRDHAGANVLGFGRGPHQFKVGRVAVAVASQRAGLGTALMQAIQAWIVGFNFQISGVMSAQAHLEPWYTRLGWEREGETYLEAGIEHIKMRYTPENRA